jgi:hypothetical protein
MLRLTERAKGKPGPGRGVKASTASEPGFADAPALADLSISKKEPAVARPIASLRRTSSGSGRYGFALLPYADAPTVVVPHSAWDICPMHNPGGFMRFTDTP